LDAAMSFTARLIENEPSSTAFSLMFAQHVLTELPALRRQCRARRAGLLPNAGVIGKKCKPTKHLGLSPTNMAFTWQRWDADAVLQVLRRSLVNKKTATQEVPLREINIITQRFALVCVTEPLRVAHDDQALQKLQPASSVQ
jgi:hypothetical protein